MKIWFPHRSEHDFAERASDAGDDGAAKKRPSSSVVAVVDRFPLANTSRQSLTEKLNGLDVTALIVAKTGAGRGRDRPNVTSRPFSARFG